MTNEAGLSLENDKYLALIRENERLRELCAMSRTTIEMFMSGSAAKHPHIKQAGRMTLGTIKQELEKQDEQ